jgi:hypothetical protein
VASETATPIAFYNDGDAKFPILPCAIGTTCGQCLLDTGAMKSQISNHPDFLHYRVLESGTNRSAFGALKVDVIRIPILSIGDQFHRKDLDLVRSVEVKAAPNYLGIIGADIMAGTDFIFRVIGRKRDLTAELFLEPPPQSHLAETFVHFSPLPAPGPFIEIPVQVGDLTVRAMWDTHAQTSVFTKSFIAKHPQLFRQIDEEMSFDIQDQKGIFKIYKVLVNVCVIDFCERPGFVVSDFGLSLPSKSGEAIDVIIGTDWIYKYAWYFDYTNQRFAMAKR